MAEGTNVFDAVSGAVRSIVDAFRPPYIEGTNHAETLTTALHDFHRALSHRWIDKVCDAIVRDSRDFPVIIRRAAHHSHHPNAYQPRWDYSSPAARAHIGNWDVFGSSHCAFITWARTGQRNDLSTVTCDGATGVEPLGHPDVPTYIECGVGSIFAQVTDWAWGERTHIFSKLPLFDRHDLPALHRAHDDLVELGYHLGLEAGSGSGGSVPDPLARTPGIPALVPDVSSLPRSHSTWWSEWTGLQANAAASGFFASVEPSVGNQVGIVGLLANLYSDRAAIIEKGRNDALYWIQWATESLGQTESINTSRVGGWKAVQGIGMGIMAGWAIKGAAAGSVGGPAGAAAGGSVGAAAGAIVTLVGFLGENLAPERRTEQQRHDFVDVVEHLNDKIDDLMPPSATSKPTTARPRTRSTTGSTASTASTWRPTTSPRTAPPAPTTREVVSRRRPVISSTSRETATRSVGCTRTCCRHSPALRKPTATCRTRTVSTPLPTGWCWSCGICWSRR